MLHPLDDLFGLQSLLQQDSAYVSTMMAERSKSVTQNIFVQWGPHSDNLLVPHSILEVSSSNSYWEGFNGIKEGLSIRLMKSCVEKTRGFKKYENKQKCHIQLDNLSPIVREETAALIDMKLCQYLFTIHIIVLEPYKLSQST